MVALLLLEGWWREEEACWIHCAGVERSEVPLQDTVKRQNRSGEEDSWRIAEGAVVESMYRERRCW